MFPPKKSSSWNRLVHRGCALDALADVVRPAREAEPFLAVDEALDVLGRPLDREVVPPGQVDAALLGELLLHLARVVRVVDERLGAVLAGRAVLQVVVLTVLRPPVRVGPQDQRRVVLPAVVLGRRPRPDPGLPAAVTLAERGGQPSRVAARLSGQPKYPPPSTLAFSSQRRPLPAWPGRHWPMPPPASSHFVWSGTAGCSAEP